MREAQQRTVQDAVATRRDVDRLTIAQAEAAAEREQAATAHNAEVQRLQHDAQQASLAAEVNRAKAAQYDDMAAHAHNIEQELRQMREQGQAQLEAEQLAASLAAELKVCTTALGKQSLLWNHRVQCAYAAVTCTLP